MSIVLGGKDEIVDGPAIRSHILSFHEENKDRLGSFRLMYWKNARHNACLMLPYKWRKMSKLLLEQEGVVKPDVAKVGSKKR